jgi:type IV secretion system protein VirB10
MADAPNPNGTPPVTDHRPVPRPALPRSMQTWLMVGLAVGMLAIIFVAGRPEAPSERAKAPAVASTPNTDRVRDYQDRLRALEAQAVLEDQASTAQVPVTAASPASEGDAFPTEDPIAAEKKRRNYESLFAANVVMSRRPPNERPDAASASGAPTRSTETDRTPPSIDEIADAAVRATVRAQGTAAGPPGGVLQQGAPAPPAPATAQSQSTGHDTRSYTEPLSVTGPLHTVLEGTLIDTVLTNRLESSGISPVNCLVTDPLYSHRGRVVLIPAGARLLGETKPVQAFGETRLAVAFHRLLMPDGSTHSLNQFMGLNQLGDAGLRDRVNQHYLSTFGAAAAVGLISGLAQFLGTAGLRNESGSGAVVVAGSGSDATAQASMQVLNRFLNRPPTVTIREGHRVRVYITNDLELPAYPLQSSSRF